MNALAPMWLLSLLGSALVAQTGGSGGQPAVPLPGGQGPGAQEPTGPPQPPPFVPGTQLPGASNPRDVIWTLPRPPGTFEGLPVAPSMLAGYGSYTSLESALLARKLLMPPLPLVGGPPEPPGWPSWVRTRDKAALPFAPELALLVRHSDRVWQRPAADEPFTPLYFHDKLRTLAAGAAVEVRQTGEFELLLHTSSRLLARGPTAIELGKLSATDVQLRITGLTWLRLCTAGRLHTLELPDGSTVRVAPGAAAAGAAPPSLPFLSGTLGAPPAAAVEGFGDLLLVRAEEPSWLGGRVTLTNFGTGEVTWRHASGEVVVPPAHRVTLFLRGSRVVVPMALTAVGAEVRNDGARVVCSSASGGTVSYCGARFELAPGTSVELDPQQGRPFERAAARTP